MRHITTKPWLIFIFIVVGLFIIVTILDWLVLPTLPDATRNIWYYVVTVLAVILGVLSAIFTIFGFSLKNWMGKYSIQNQENDDNNNSSNEIQIVDKYRETSQENLDKALLLSPADHTEDSLFGIDDVIEEISKPLRNQNGDWVLSLWGDGGIGKTTIVHEVLHRHAIDAGFTNFAWVDVIPRDELRASKYSMIQLNQALDKASEQLGFSRGPGDRQKIRDFANHIHNLSENERVLIVMDNLEGMEDPELLREFISSEHKIIDPHKILLTTRHSASETLNYVGHHSKNVERLSEQNVYKFITYLGRSQKDIEIIAPRILDDVEQITQGNPFLIKLIIARLFDEGKPLDYIITDLKAMRGEEKRLFNPSIERFKELVGPENASRLLQAFCRSSDLLDRKKLQKYSGIEDVEQFDRALSTAVRLSLVRSSELNKRFSIHSLMKATICSKKRTKRTA